MQQSLLQIDYMNCNIINWLIMLEAGCVNQGNKKMINRGSGKSSSTFGEVLYDYFICGY